MSLIGKSYDCLLVGAGLTGAVLAYELQKLGQRTLLLEKSPRPLNATALSYGGIPYWAGQSPWQKRLCQESRLLFSQLDQELGAGTEYRELDLLLYLQPGDDPQILAQNFQSCRMAPQFLDAETSVELEPQLNPGAITGAFRVPHGHVHPGKLLNAYLGAFTRLGGEIVLEKVQSLAPKEVKTTQNVYRSEHVVLCNGAEARGFLQSLGLNPALYFSQAQLLKTAPTNERLRTLAMPARFGRLALEAQAPQWDWDSQNPQTWAEILEVGGVQFLDGSLCLGQITQFTPRLNHRPDLAQAERKLRSAVGAILPNLAALAGQAFNCSVAFNPSPYPLVGAAPGQENLYLFTGFSSPFCYVPPLARHFAQALTGQISQIYQEVEGKTRSAFHNS
ncbi:MAG: FAD-dependent oxidoreductase [Cyanobacteria bacterium RI_101]|nr:FAD-dependent oxidoreductase [Cyanobacteria bacterium RI_101]